MKTSMKSLFSAGVLLALLLVVFTPVFAQAGLTLRVDKDFGYNAGSNIRGTFTLDARGPQGMTSVTFLVDGQEIGRVDQAPFELQISTNDFPAGDHALLARGLQADGTILESPVRNFRFLSREEEASGMKNILVPLLGIIALITVGGFAVQMLAARGAQPKPMGSFTKHAYRSGWGAICSRCQLPTPVHMTGLNLGFFTKFDRCENCGKWSLMRVRPAREMEAYARTVEAQAGPQVQAESEEERLRRQVDDSRFTD